MNEKQIANHAVSRRDFVRTAAALSAAAVITPDLLARSAKPGASDALRVGVVGCGGRGTGAVVQALRADPGSVLWSMGDLFNEQIDPCLERTSNAMHALDEEQGTTSWASKVDVDPSRKFSGFDNYQRVIDSGVDVVILTTPPAFRPEHLAAAVGAGKHVFCEKPVAVDGPGVRSVLESAKLAKANKTSLMSGFCWRHHDQVVQAIDKLRAGAIGDLHTIQTTYNTTGWVQPKPRKDAWSDAEFQVRNWQYFHPISGDHVVEQAVHSIDWMAWAMGDAPPERCYAVGGRQTRPDVPESGNVFDHFSVTYEYAGGVRGYHMCRHWPNSASDNSGFFLGSSGRLSLQPWTGSSSIEGAESWRTTAEPNDMYQREHDTLFKAIRADKPYNDAVRMAHSTLLAIMGRAAAYTGQSITWDQALNSAEDLNPDGWALSSRPTPEVAVPGRTKFG